MFTLYRYEKPILNYCYWEDLVDFVEELKALNKKYLDRGIFTVRSNNEVIYSWKRK